MGRRSVYKGEAVGREMILSAARGVIFFFCQARLNSYSMVIKSLVEKDLEVFWIEIYFFDFH